MNKKRNDQEPNRGVTKERKACTKRVSDALYQTGSSVHELVSQSALSEGTVRRALSGEVVTMDTVFEVARFLKKPPEFFFVGEPKDKDIAFKEELWALAKDIPEKKREQLLEIVAAYCKAVSANSGEKG